MAHDHHGAFGQDAFGRGAERAARFFGTPRYIVAQSDLLRDNTELTQRIETLAREIREHVRRSD